MKVCCVFFLIGVKMGVKKVLLPFIGFRKTEVKNKKELGVC